MQAFLIPVSNSQDNLSPNTIAKNSITHVIDQHSKDSAPRVAQDILSALDAEQLALLRRSDFGLRQTGTSRFICGCCKEPVHVRVTSVAQSGCVDGSRAVFVHDPRPVPRDCPFGSLGSPTSAGEVDAARFNGRQEGARHKRLKTMLCQMLSADPNIATAECEVLVTGLGADGRAVWRRPDVLAVTTDGRRLAFDVQIASPLLTTIDGRERFYAAQGIAWHWIVDANQPERLHLQGFQDLTMPQACRVLGFNEEITTLSKTDNQSRFHLLHLTETIDGRSFKVRSKKIGLDAALNFAGFPQGGPPPHATDLRALGFFKAIYKDDLTCARQIYNLLTAHCAAPDWAQAQQDAIPDGIKILLLLASNRDLKEAEAAICAFFCADAPQNGSPALSHWAFLIATAATCDPTLRAQIARLSPSTRALLAKALRESAQNPTLARQFRGTWSAVLRRLFPRC
ncbi:competence protein CoiA family protein [Phaeovulum sp. W22_SRMD_FR3]|uniref:competence protein CoiA family protein n=1 Tax=Phaeovulum sp. W22_SRMD_FR3 TaxID=3240274 RepID=UPI003F9D02E3